MDEMIIHIDELLVDAEGGLRRREVADAIDLATPGALDAEVLDEVADAIATSPAIDLGIQETRREHRERRESGVDLP